MRHALGLLLLLIAATIAAWGVRRLFSSKKRERGIRFKIDRDPE